LDEMRMPPGGVIRRADFFWPGDAPACGFLPNGRTKKRIPQGFRHSPGYYGLEPQEFRNIFNPPNAMNDTELDHLLKAARTPAIPPSGFQRDVWLRIEAAESNGCKPRVNRMLEVFLGFFAMPPVALATCAAMVLIGAWFGMQPQDTGRSGETAYVQSISPFAHNPR
jgi:hypothetical protein